MNGQELLADLKQKTGDTQITWEQAKPLFNHALDVISKFLKEPAKAQAAINTIQDEYTLPDNYLKGSMQKVVFIKNGEDTEYILEKMSFLEVNTATTRGTPTGYYIINNKLGFVPRTNTSGTAIVYYYKRLPQLDNDNDVPYLDPVDHEMIVEYAAKLYKEGQGDFDESAIFERNFEKKLLLLRGEESLPRTVKVVFT